MARSVVLLSSGMDSTVNLYSALKDSEVCLALTFDYGQKSAGREVEHSEAICKKLSVKHKVLSLNFFKDIGQSSLIGESGKIPSGKDISMDDRELSLKSAKSVWVPNRNGIFLNIAAGFAESLGAEHVVPGFNSEEAATFPDNSLGYINKLNESFEYSTATHVRVFCYTTNMSKTEIVARGQELGVDWKMMWPCYHNFEKWCGLCESCQRSKRALENQKVKLDGVWQ